MADDHNLTEEQIAEYKAAFRIFDKDGSGSITTDELGTVLRSIGKNVTDAELQKIVDDVDDNGNGTLDFDEFLSLMTQMMSEADTEKDIREAFKVFDTNGDGFITVKELRKLMMTLGEKMTEEEAEEMVQAGDTNGDGKINYEEFAKIMLT